MRVTPCHAAPPAQYWHIHRTGVERTKLLLLLPSLLLHQLLLLTVLLPPPLWRMHNSTHSDEGQAGSVQVYPLGHVPELSVL
jgi:hypothetical protein